MLREAGRQDAAKSRRARSGGQAGLVAVAGCVVGLAGMAYCHIKDVGMKFEEHVYYMAALFCCNIVASLALIPFVIYATTQSGTRARRIWCAAGALAILTILGFLWSRTIGFPQMEDHIGQWDTLGITSLGFEVLVLGASAWMLFRLSRGSRA